MHMSSLIGLVLFSSFAIADTDDSDHSQRCVHPRVRKSWHYMTDEAKLEYTRAVKCLWSLPGKGTADFPAVRNRHEDFSSLHINQTTAPDPTNNPANRGVVGPGIHFNGVFLGWHRYLVWTYETTLINECNYTGGGVPYWDWSLDTSEYGRSMELSPVFDPITGFGGNGANGTVPLGNQNFSAIPPGSCVGDGPFVGLSSNLGPGFNLDTPRPHCIIRNFNTSLFDSALQWEKNVVPLLRIQDYANFTYQFDFPSTGAPTGIHGGGHGGVSGEMINVWSSINDPLFYMHHAQIDHVWWTWQNLQPENLWAIGGPIYPNGTGTTTLDSPIYMSPYTAPDVKIGNVMDSLNRNGEGVLCYVYESDGHEYPY